MCLVLLCYIRGNQGIRQEVVAGLMDSSLSCRSHELRFENTDFSRRDKFPSFTQQISSGSLSRRNPKFPPDA